MKYIEGVDIVMRENGYRLREVHPNVNRDAHTYCYRNTKNKWLVVHTFCYDLDVTTVWLDSYRAGFKDYVPMSVTEKDRMVKTYAD